MDKSSALEAALIVAHPDDETIWAGGTVLMNSDWCWTVVSLCRASDADRAPKFHKAVYELRAEGKIGDLDDGPEQAPLPENQVRQTLLDLLPKHRFDIVLTHSSYGEYTRHQRHEETGSAVCTLWKAGRLQSSALWLFAYRDKRTGGISDVPTPERGAHRSIVLPENVFSKKLHIILDCYGFSKDSYEAAAVQRMEAFWCFDSPAELDMWLSAQGRDP